MALRLRRDVQKASYYVWFLGAEEAKGLRGSRVIHSVLPYLIDRSRGQEPLKVTLQVSHKGIKILQGSSKHFIPHSAITSSVQTDDIVACVLLLYNPATKCPLHVHAYRCDSESTAEALNQQLQTLINRPENQKRFEELENRLGILPPMPMSSHNKSSAATSSSSHNKVEHSQKQQQYHQSQLQQPQHRRLESSPKRFSSSLGSDTGNSTRESECSEEHSGSPVSRSPPMLKPLQQNNELFDSLAAELRAKLNGNGPPILLPPRDYDTVHRSKGNLTAIELRRCRNKLIVGSTTSATTTTPAVTGTNGIGSAVKQVSSRGSSGIGSDLAPSPERQELNSSSDDDRWSNEADNSVIALKPSQIPIERPAVPIISHHPQLNRKSAMQPPEDSYLRDLPAKPYTPHISSSGRNATSNNVNVSSKANHHSRDKQQSSTTATSSSQHSKTTSSTPSWTREDEIKPIIMRPADYDAKFNRVLQAEHKQEFNRSVERDHTKLQDTDKYNEINRLLNKKHSRDRESPERPPRYAHKVEELDDFVDSDPSNEHLPLHATSSAGYRKENLTDKQKFIEYTSQKKTKPYTVEESQRYGGRHRYVDPSDLPFEQAPHKKYPAVHRAAVSPDRSDVGRSTAERQRDRQRMPEENKPRSHSGREHERERDRFSRSSDRNPYREPESIPYIQSMEKMMKSTALHYTAYDASTEPTTVLKDDPTVAPHTKVSSQRSKSYPKHDDDRREDFGYSRNGRPDYAPSTTGSKVSPKDRFKDAKNKFHAMERTGSRYDLTDEKDGSVDYKPRRRGSVEPVSADAARIYNDWSDEERLDDSPPPPPVHRSSSRSRDHWEQSAPAVPIRERERDILPPRERDGVREREARDLRNTRDVHEHRDYSRDVRARELPGMRPEPKETREHRELREPRDNYRENRYDPRELPHRAHEREANRDIPRERQRSERTRDLSHDYAREHRDTRRDYTPEARSATGDHHRSDYPDRAIDKQRSTHSTDKYPPPPTGGAPIPNAKMMSNLRDQPKGYRHSYAEPVFARSGGRVGLAAVNPF